MDQLRIGTEHEVGDVQDLALLIVDPDRKGLRAGDYFQKTAHSLLSACILHLSYKAKVEFAGNLRRAWGDAGRRPPADPSSLGRIVG